MFHPSNATVIARLVLAWLGERTGAPVELLDGDAGVAVHGRLGAETVVLAVESLSSAEQPAGWQAGLDRFGARLDPRSEGAVILWLPAGAAPPAEEPAATVAVRAVQAAIDAVPPGESRDALLPIVLGLQKRDDNGAYVSAFGGLAPLWAQFTDRVQGYYQIDSTALHRLPEDEAEVRALIDRVITASAGMALGEARMVDADDRWRVQRLRDGSGCTVIAAPPGDETESGAPLRRRLRAVLRGTGERLADGRPALRVLALLGHYPTIEADQAGPALRGQDPSLFAGLDLIVVVADGAVKPLLDVGRRLAAPGATAG
ncbi:MAG TPA: hypothetical protein VFD32_19900 [Dehalococcoidia bacterium]|nr:hypothetical protein [Dehalococcoidia bacterium]